MKVPFYSTNPSHAQAIGTILRDKIASYTQSNSFLAQYNPVLNKKISLLSAALTRLSDKDLTRISVDTDKSFDKRCKKLFRLIDFKAGDEDFGDEAIAAAELLKVIHAVDKNLMELEREVQINRFDLLITAFAPDVMQQHLEMAQVRKLYELTVTDHKKLKENEEKRALFSTENEVPPTWDARNDLIPVLDAVYSHIQDFAVVNDEYNKLYKEIVAELKPIITQVNADKTRAKNAHEGSAE